MTQYILGLALILLTMPVDGLAQEGPPRPDTNNSGSGSVQRLGDRKDQYGDAPWLKRTPVATPNSETWYRTRSRRDIEALNRTCRELLEQAEKPSPADRRTIARGAAKAAKLSRSLWNNLQRGKSNRTKPESEIRKVAHQASDPVEGIRALKRLIDDVTQAVTDEDRTQTLDVKRQSEILDKLEEINRLALEISRASGR